MALSETDPKTVFDEVLGTTQALWRTSAYRTGQLPVLIIDDIDDLKTIENAWRDLASRTVDCRFSQTYDWALSAWDSLSPRENPQLRCLTIWDGPRLSAVWPFVVLKEGLVSRAVPLGCGLNEEYSDPLMDDAFPANRVAFDLWTTAKELADQLVLYFVRAGSPVQRIAHSDKALRAIQTLPALSIDWGDAASWADVEAKRSSKMRYDLRRDAKRLAELGEVRFGPAKTEVERHTAIDWLITRKQQWLKLTHNRKDWYHSAQAVNFLKSISAAQSDIGRMSVFTLRAGETIVAAAICTIDRQTVEGYIITFDQAYAKCAPGIALIDHLSRWCFDNRRILDMRMMAQTYKARLATQVVDYHGYVTACTPAGRLRVATHLLHLQLRETVKSLLNEDQIEGFKALKRSGKLSRLGKAFADLSADTAPSGKS